MRVVGGPGAEKDGGKEREGGRVGEVRAVESPLLELPIEVPSVL